MIKIAVIWGHHRNDVQFTVHHHFWEATLARRSDIEFKRFTWSEWPFMSRDFDLYFFIDWHPSLFRLNNSVYHPRILYWWDAFHHTFVYLSQLVELFDHCYLSELPTVRGLQVQGYENVSWLPSAFYQEVYRPIQMNKVHNYAFVGQLDDVVTRRELTRKGFIYKLAQASGLHGFVGQGVYGHQVNSIYNESEVLFDWTIANNLGTRFFEAIGSGGFLLMNSSKVNGAEQIAQDGVHYVSYDGSYNDFEGKLRYYLSHEEERQKIAKAGHKHFLDNHTYSHRLNKILADFNLDKKSYILSPERFDRSQDRLPVYINNRNRLGHMLKLIDWLQKIPYVDITILDNASTYPPLLEWYAKTKIKVILLKQNIGHHALWQYRSEKQIPFLTPGDWFVYTDADLVPREECPLDAFQYMRKVMLEQPEITKVGFGIEINDLPDHYPLKMDVQSWEKQFWTPEKKIGLGIFRANLDTTMALYNKNRVKLTDPTYPPPCYRDVVDAAIRCDYPYVVRHLPWYVNPNNLDEEEKFFMDHAEWYSSWTHALKGKLKKNA